MEQKKRNPVARFFGRLFVIALLLLVVLAAIAAYTVLRQRATIASLEARVDNIKAEMVPLRFMVLSRSEESVSARFRFYTADGQEIASFERSWNGWELAIDTLIVPVGERYFAFPARVFTDAVAPGRGTDLFPYYDRSGFPAIYDAKALRQGDRTALSELFIQIRAYSQAPVDTALHDPQNLGNSLLRGLFGNAVHDVKRLRGFEVGAVYAMIVRSSGAIEIIRE